MKYTSDGIAQLGNLKSETCLMLALLLESMAS